MSRRKTPPKRPVAPDNRYGNTHITMFVNRLMKGGKRSVALSIMYDALTRIEEKLKKHPVDVMETAINNVRPAIEVKATRVGGSTYQVPTEVPMQRGLTLAMRWILETSRSRGGKDMAEKLAAELMDAASGQGASVKKKDDTHRMAEANRAFAHFK